MQNIIKRNLLKYAAGRAIHCPACGAILDYRRIVAYETPAGRAGVSCADCWRKGLEMIHDDKPHAYLLSIGWKAETLVDFEKPARKAKAKPAKPKMMTPAAIRRAIFAGHKLAGNCTKHDRLFPTIAPWRARPPGELVERPAMVDYDGREVFYDYPADVISSPAITAQYVADYCRLNHLTA